MRIHHVGYAVRKHEAAEQAFAALGFTIGRRTTDEGRNVVISFAEQDGYRVELVSPASPDSPVDGVLSKVGPSAYHVCFITDDIAASVADLAGQGWRALGEPSPAPAINYANVVFLYHVRVGLIELVELASAGQGEVL